MATSKRGPGKGKPAATKKASPSDDLREPSHAAEADARGGQAAEHALLAAITLTGAPDTERRKAILEMVDMGRARGFLSEDEVQAQVTAGPADSDHLQRIVTILSEMGIAVYRAAPPMTLGLVVQEDPLLGRPVDELGLAPGIGEHLKTMKIATIGDLTERTEKELLAAPELGRTALSKIRDRLADFGLTLRMARRLLHHDRANAGEGIRCTLAFVCSRAWDDLVPTGSSSVRFCGRCSKNVYRCTTEQDVAVAIAKGRCVAVIHRRA